MALFLSRMWGAATLDTGVYEDVECDPRATTQAFVVIVLGSLAAAFGASGWNASPQTIIKHSIITGGLAMLAWVSWAFVTFEIGSRLLPQPHTHVDVPELLRTIGFSAAPALLLVLGAFGDTTAVFTITAIWMMATMVVAVRQALDYSTTTRAVAVCVLGSLLTMVFAIMLSLVFEPALGA